MPDNSEPKENTAEAESDVANTEKEESKTEEAVIQSKDTITLLEELFYSTGGDTHQSEDVASQTGTDSTQPEDGGSSTEGDTHQSEDVASQTGTDSTQPEDGGNSTEGDTHQSEDVASQTDTDSNQPEDSGNSTEGDTHQSEDVASQTGTDSTQPEDDGNSTEGDTHQSEDVASQTEIDSNQPEYKNISVKDDHNTPEDDSVQIEFDIELSEAKVNSADGDKNKAQDVLLPDEEIADINITIYPEKAKINASFHGYSELSKLDYPRTLHSSVPLKTSSLLKGSNNKHYQLRGASNMPETPSTPTANEAQTDTNQKPFVEVFYDKVNDVLGGTNSNQFLTLIFPGLSLYKKDFSYDLEHNEPKGAVVEEKESLLANKLYDACSVTGSDNGMTLQYQYQTALDCLSPKLNKHVVDLKNQCRDLINTNIYYDFADGKGEQKVTLSTAFFRLYASYIDSLQKWAQVQAKEKADLQSSFDINNPEGARQYENAYQEWFSTVAPSHLQDLDEQYARVLTVFSPNDMKILEGILDSGVGAEIQECRDTLRNFKKLSQYGGHYYPVNFQPSNWFDFLDTNFSKMDLLESPAAIQNKIISLKGQLDNYNAQIMQLTAIVPSNKDIENSTNAIKAAEATLDASRAELMSQCGEMAGKAFDTVATSVLSYYKRYQAVPQEVSTLIENSVAAYNDVSDIVDPKKDDDKDGGDKNDGDKNDGDKNDGDKNDGGKDGGDKDGGDKDGGDKDGGDKDGGDKDGGGKDTGVAATIIKNITTLVKDSGKLFSPIEALANATQDLSKSLGASISANNLHQFSTLLTNLQTKVKSLDSEISDALVEFSLASRKAEHELKNKDNSSAADLATEIPKGYMQVLIDAQASTLDSTSNSNLYSKVSTHGSSFLFIGHSHTKTHTESSYNSVSKGSDVKIQIAMNVAKVGIERPWFNPGVFAITKDTFNMSAQSISPKNSYQEFSKERFDNMSKCIFPCYPVALVIARDVSIRFTSSTTDMSSFARTVEDHSKTGGGFLGFNASSSTNSSNQSSSSHVFSTSNSVTIRFDTPQVIGVYQEAVRPDLSSKMQFTNNADRNNANEEEMNFLDFLKAYSALINSRNAEHKSN